MKSRLRLCQLILLLISLQSTLVEAVTCSPPFTALPYASGLYCGKCDVTCATCSGTSINSCSSCPQDFTIQTSTSTCVAPSSTTISTVASLYHNFGFQMETGWTGGTGVYSACGIISVLRATGTSTITVTHTLQSHYKVRIMVSLWWFSGTSANITVQLATSTNANIGNDTAAPTGVAGTIAGASLNPYCANSQATNFELQVTDTNSYNDVKVNFKSTISPSDWGLRQYVLIQYLCSQPDCKTCFGPASTQCYTCNDANKKVYASPYGSCLCKFQNGYYAYPTGNSTLYCVDRCPNFLSTGQYYGDNTTKTCVTTCPAVTGAPQWGLTFASDQYGICVQICNPTITLGGVTANLYYDKTNRKCTTKCPSTEPYSWSIDRACYANCPANSGTQYYKLNTDMTCVSVCPNITQGSNVAIPLYIDNTTNTCVTECDDSIGYWGYLDPSTGVRSCILNCPHGYFKDLSSGRPLCTKVCPQPDWFGDFNSLPPACVQTCSFGTYGDQTSSDRFCVTKCNGSYYGLRTGDRTCIQNCPTGTWGQPVTMSCATSPHQCMTLRTNPFTGAQTLASGASFSTSVFSFADSHLRKCILANVQCSVGQFKQNSTYLCVKTCPLNSYANNITYWCVDKCYGDYFADNETQKCVKVCSPGYFADRGSVDGNKCVKNCNQTGGYRFRDSNNRQCVAICTAGYADALAQSCVYNCTPPLYLDNSNPSQLVCTGHCPSPYFAYNNSDSGICVLTCPQEPPLFGDVVQGYRLCVQVCQVGKFGDQTSGSFRWCVSPCPNNTFGQNDTLRRCVTRCSDGTYGRQSDWTCVDPLDCQINYTGDPTTNMCVDWCPPSAGTFADNISKLCVQKCPIDNTTYYYADVHTRWCIPTCINYNSSFNQFGNNSTQTCETKCLDRNSFADAQSPRRFCIDVCTWSGGVKYYRNNHTRICVVSTGCTGTYNFNATLTYTQYYFADNYTLYCVQKCPNISGVPSWGYIPTLTCVQLCYGDTWGDNSTGIPLCVTKCSDYPTPLWSYNGPGNKTVMLCVSVCPAPYFGEDYDRTCVENCPRENSVHNQTYAYTGTRRCLLNCPDGTWADYITGVCFHYSINCTAPCWYTNTSCSTYRWASNYNNSCVYLCNSSPYNQYGDNLTRKCTGRCSLLSYADNQTGTRICVARCPGEYTVDGDVNGPYDSYGDNNTQSCVRHCQQPDTYADWQLSLCLYRCMGDDETLWVPTYANIFTMRCVISLYCPVSPDLYYGQNLTRTCQTACPLNDTYVSFADNITRMCIPQCYNFTNSTNTSLITRFFGDVSTERPVCVIACPKVPRLFGENVTNLCVEECPDFQFGDQTGNRSCVRVCPNIGGVTWFSQLTERICVLVCQNGTWGNYYNFVGPHCETVGTDCNITYYGDNSTHMCVPLCPQTMNYFGQPHSRLCTDRCPYLNASTMVLVNLTAGINLTEGRLFADYKTRLCVYKCPADFGPQGTFGDNTTNTCVAVCPANSYGDANTTNRYCVQTCTGGAFADDLTMLCVDVCPASPPTFGYEGNWTCLKSCPNNLWAKSSTRRCQSSCNPGFRLTLDTNTCVGVCPSDPDLYGDTTDYNCTAVCSNGKFADPTDRMCKAGCLPLFQYNYRCVKFCPEGYFANSTGDCVPPAQCDGGTYGQNSTTNCTDTCPSGSFADPVSRYCIAVCPDDYYGDNLKCVQSCNTTNTFASNISQLCQSICPNYTYGYLGQCYTNCSGSTYENDVTHLCDSSCPSGQFADPVTNRCVKYCPTGYYRQSSGANAGRCVQQNAGCSPLFADFITGNCVTKCSTGYWGYTGNYTCNPTCPRNLGLFGYASTTERTCYAPNSLPSGAPMLFADAQSGEFVAVCPETPNITFGDRNRQLCVTVCQNFSTTDYYGDPQTRQCQSVCQSASQYTADPKTSLCTLRCSYGTFRYNNTPICVTNCPSGYGDFTSRICVATCGQLTNTFGFHNMTSGYKVCLAVCPAGYYSENVTRTCTQLCPGTLGVSTMYYAYNNTRQCMTYCNDSFADDSNKICVKQCLSLTYPNADNSTNRCVSICPSDPDLYADDHVCVHYCTTPGYFADSNGRQCKSRCSNISGSTGYNQYGDPRTGRCEVNCSLYSWGDNSTNLCVTTCPPQSFADNTTGKCVAECPKVEGIYADMLLHVCASTCSGGYFGSQINQTCVRVCDDGYYGDPTTTLCTNICPVKIYSYGQNVTRTCVTSCKGWVGPGGIIGYADNYSRLCRNICQDTLAVQTYKDQINQACVQTCHLGYYAQNDTNTCVQKCPNSTFADNFSRYCLDVCPDNPQSYGDTLLNICIYSCLRGQFSDNTTNLCVPVCPGLNISTVDYYGDSHTGRCVKWCTEGTYAENDTRRCLGVCPEGSFADNLTRRCVQDCPPEEYTFADPTTHRCVRICPAGYWAENTTQTCQLECWNYTLTRQSYADNISNFCVAQCPFGYFGDNTTHNCETTCSATRDQYGHPIGRVCVARLDCYPDNSTGKIYYADSTTRRCVQKCPLTLWADKNIFVCMPSCNSSIPEFKNLHTQMCVWPCPSDPDQYADSGNGNCVRTCTPGTYAYMNNRTCQPSCAPFSLYADNQTHRCVTQCSTLPYYYADSLVWKCVYHCSGGYFADNRTQTCVPVCPSEWALFGEKHNYTCVSLCPEGEFADPLDGRICSSTCSNSTFADNFTSSCVQHCKDVRPFWFEHVSGGIRVCVDVCPGQSYGYLPDQTCKYQSGLSSTCPGDYYADRISRHCVTLCPNGTYSFITTKYCQSSCDGSYYADPILRKCVTNCSLNLFKYEEDINTNICVQYCPSTKFARNASGGNDSACVDRCWGMLGLNTTRTCQNSCPYPFYADGTVDLCVTNCTPLYSFMPNRTCLVQCAEPYYGNPLTFTCDLLCPLNYFGDNTTRMCSLKCPNQSFADPSIRICVAECPEHPSLYADERSNQCLPGCLAPLFAYDPSRQCVSSCPNVTVGSVEFRYLADPFVRACVLQCNNQEISFADYDNNICTKKCPPKFFANNATKQCVIICPNIPNDTFSDNTSRICMDVCLPGSFGNHDTLNCVQHCWWPYFADPTTRTCVQYCPQGYFSDNGTATCIDRCPTNSYADPVTNRCLGRCPALHRYFDYDGNWTCLQTCPPGFYANTDVQKCMSICNSSSGMFSYSPTNQCVRQCPIPYRGFTPNNTCVLSCPSIGYFYDVTINQCAVCDSKCYICISLSTCQQCLGGYNLFNGYCNISCIPTTIITYANAQGVCVDVCPPGTFGNNQSYSCVSASGCPTQQYGQPTTRLCTLCPMTCTACTSSTFCTACQAAATLAIDNMCYSNCNSTFKYSYNGTCWNTCPDGSYLTYTNVICAACASICSTCFGTATNCTSCKASYYYGQTCLTSCPSNFYGDASTLTCINCSVLSSSSCSQPLKYSTTYTIQNFQPVITLQFNQNVTLMKNLQEILKIRLVANRLLQIGTLVNNGVTYTYEILSNGTIKIYLNVGTSLVNPVFSVDINDPSAVVSSTTGMSLQNVQSLLNMAKIDYYPPEDGQEAGTNFPATFAVVIFLLLYVVTFVFSDVMVRPLQFLQLLFLHCLIDSPISANLYFPLRGLQSSTLSFITNWFKDSFSTKSVYYDTPLKIQDACIDYIFLRNVGQIFVVIVVLACFWFLFLILGNKKIVSHKIWHSFLNQVSQKRYRSMVVNDVLSLFYLPITYFGFWQFTHLFGEGVYGFNGFSALAFVLAAIVLPIVWLGLWCKRSPQDLHNTLWFLTLRVKVPPSENAVVHDDKSEEHLKQQSQSSGPAPIPSKQNPYQTETLVFYLYMLLCSIWMVGLYHAIMAQLVLLIITNALFLIYLVKFRPYLNKINLIFTIIYVLTVITLQAFFIHFYQTDQHTFAFQKTATAYPFVVTLCVVLILLIIWALWRVVWQVSLYIRNFKSTLLYLQFADHEYVGEQEQTQKYSQYDKLAQKMQAGVGDTIVQKIQDAVNEVGEKVIKVTKKKLVKKSKVKGRKKHQPLPQDQNTNQEYIRINQINVFDYNDQFDEPEPVAKEPEPPARPKKNIDDDIRDIVSDYSEQIDRRMYDQEEEEKKIEVEPGEIIIRNIDELSNIDQVGPSDKQSEYPFIDIELQQDVKRSEQEKKNEEIEIQSNPQQLYQLEEPSKPIAAKLPPYDPERDYEKEEDYQQIQSSSLFQDKKAQEPIHQEELSPSVTSPKQAKRQRVPQTFDLDFEFQDDEPQVKPKPVRKFAEEGNNQQKKIVNLQDLIEEEEGKKKNLLFLFDDFDE